MNIKHILFFLLFFAGVTIAQNTYGDEMVNNPYFETNHTGWNSNGTPVTREWVASGGGFTGAEHVVGDGTNDGMVQIIGPFVTDCTYVFSWDINIISNTGTVRISLYGAGNGYKATTMLNNATATGIYADSINWTATASENMYVWIFQSSTAPCEFYADNISVKMVLPDPIPPPATSTPERKYKHYNNWRGFRP